jgi:hypothetical protein
MFLYKAISLEQKRTLRVFLVKEILKSLRGLVRLTHTMITLHVQVKHLHATHCSQIHQQTLEAYRIKTM